MNVAVKSKLFTASQTDVDLDTLIPKDSRLIGFIILSATGVSDSVQLALKLDFNGAVIAAVWGYCDDADRIAMKWFGNENAPRTIDSPTSPTFTAGTAEVKGGLPGGCPLRWQEPDPGGYIGKVKINVSIVGAGGAAALFYTTDPNYPGQDVVP